MRHVTLDCRSAGVDAKRAGLSSSGCLMNQIAQPSEATRAARDAVIAETRKTRWGVLSLDLRDQDHLAWLTERLGGETDLSRYFPASRAMLEATRIRHLSHGGPERTTLLEIADPPIDRWLPYVNLTFYGLTQGNDKVVAQGVVTLPGDVTSVDISLQIIDNGTGDTVADVSLPTQFNTMTQIINADAMVRDQEAIDYTIILTASIVPAGSNIAAPVVVTRDLKGPNLIQRVTALNPNHNSHPERTYIKVALNRNVGNQPDVDYWYNFGTNGKPTPIVGLQVNGYAQLVSGATVSNNPGFNGSCILRRRSVGGDGASLAFPPSDIPALCNGDQGVVGWDIGPNWFQNAPWDQNQDIDLDFVLNFTASVSGLPQQAQLRVTSVPAVVSANPPANIGVVAPIQFVWGCVAAGTLVTLADGRRAPVEIIGEGEQVATPDGGSLVVRRVSIGRETRPVARMVLADGRSVVLTDEHPVLTPAGARLAGELKAGETVLTADGPAILEAVEFAAYDGTVHNLDLAPAGVDPADLPDDAVTAFLAGGFAVGDNRMQGLVSRRIDAERRARDPLDVLPERWRLDVINTRRRAQGLPCLEARQAV